MSIFSKLRKKYHYSWILLRELVRTDFKLRYQGSILGYVWSLLRPLFLFIILYFVFTVFLRVDGNMPHWPVGLLVGIVLWTFFSDITNAAVGAIVGKGDIIRKVNFPKYIIIFASSISALINLAFNLIVIFIFILINGVHFSTGALIAPIFVLEIFIFGLGLAFILSALFVKFRDVNFIWEIIMQGAFYASIVLYPASELLRRGAEYFDITQALLMNPVAQAIQDVRHFLISPEYQTLWTVGGALKMLVPLILVVATLIFGMWLFRRNSPKFAEEI